MSRTTVVEVVAAYGAGQLAIDQAAEQLSTLLVPMVKRPPAKTLHERYRREQSDELPPDQPPNSWGDVLDAYQVRGIISAEQYYALLDRVIIPHAVYEQPGA